MPALPGARRHAPLPGAVGSPAQSSLPAEAIASRLDDRFRLLTKGPRDVPPRQQTLQATLDWSWDLLSAAEPALLLRLSVFAGGWTLEAAEAVCADDTGAAWGVLDLLDGLVNKSLVQVDEHEDATRYRLLESVRQYAWQRLVASGTQELLQKRHLAWCLALAEQAEPELRGPAQQKWIERLEREHDNLRLALHWSIQERGDGGAGLRLASALVRFWSIRGHLSEGRRWLESALAQENGAPQADRARAMNGAGSLAASQGDFAQARTLYEGSLALQQALGDRQGAARALTNLGNVAAHQGDYARARVLLEQGLTLRRALDDKPGIALTLDSLGNLAMWEGDYARAQALLEESVTMSRVLRGKRDVAVSLNNLGGVLVLQGEYARAQAVLEESLTLYRPLGDKEGIAVALGSLGTIARRRGDHLQAAALYREVLVLAHELGNKELMAGCLADLAAVAGAQGLSRRAAQLFGVAETLRETIDVPLAPAERPDHDQTVQALRATLGELDTAAAWAAGRALPLEEAIALALEADSAH